MNEASLSLVVPFTACYPVYMVVRWLARLIFTPYRAVPAAAAESTALSCLYSLRLESSQRLIHPFERVYARSLSQGPIEVIDEAFRLPFLLPRVRMTQRESSQRLIHPFNRVCFATA